ncbi:NifB/NifX family molybdenum-iron cluster-binding protein [Desulfofundulus thermocisternus]|uniref:NifB/NifX family molybdenum-iron cluster-binding protein n=1 Tax=Desulfofundulus thermocisternus TaxID=42471 RepID=UPI0019E96EAE|nr:NifB/NifX family molybdenum-iron cluster-binding protein [Desulfofundulus thermocisternus]MBE3584649.1 NifB/NifX family molybdenum-iron cluster-binding protein [Thermoanaerobacter sp.]MCS5694744.1 NifB/NifX family molybdenum-iron cluster-binding protein [Desulfofundulus thermocisternus]
MKIALPNDRGRVNQHFGRSEEFVIFEMSGQEIKGRETISTVTLQHNHEGLAELFKSKGVEVLILGGVGPRAIQALQQYGLRVITGASGDVEEVARAYARGELVSQGIICNHGHGHGHDSHCHHGPGCGQGR